MEDGRCYAILSYSLYYSPEGESFTEPRSRFIVSNSKRPPILSLPCKSTWVRSVHRTSFLFTYLFTDLFVCLFVHLLLIF